MEGSPGISENQQQIKYMNLGKTHYNVYEIHLKYFTLLATK